MPEWVKIQVKVPAHRIPAFYAVVSEWLKGDGEIPEAPLGLKGTRPVPWQDMPSDEALARVLWGRLSSRARDLFGALVDQGGARITAGDLAQLLGTASGDTGIAGVLAWPTRYCAELGRTLPCNYDDGSQKSMGHYWMDSEVAALFDRVRRAE